MNKKENATFQARHHITATRLTAFFRAARGATHMLAVKLINEDLDKGRTVEELFSGELENGYTLTVEPLSQVRYRVKFGCYAGSNCGDGGEWTVTFAGDEIDGIEPETMWTA